MDLREQLKPLDAEAKRTGVGYGLPEWLRFSMGGNCWIDDNNSQFLTPDAARMIAEAGMARMLRARGHGVIYSTWTSGWYHIDHLMDDADLDTTERLLPDATDDLSALIAATLKVYATLPDAAKGGE